MTRVSIVIPCHDLGEFLPEAVQSALDQTHDDVEIVVVDDGSTDPATVALLSRPPWPGVQVHRQPNRGLAAARNAGIAIASGEYILPLDADDVLVSTYVQRAADILDGEAGVGIVYGWAELFGARRGVWQLEDFSLSRMLVENLVFASAMFRRRDWEAVGGYAEELRVREDHHFWLGILATGATIHRIDEVLFRYRIRPDSMNSTASREALVRAHARMLEDYHQLYAEHASDVVSWAFDLVDERNDWRNRYGRLERLITRHGRPYGFLRSARRRLLRGGA